MGVDVDKVRDVEPLRVKEVKGIEPIGIKHVQNIAPAAVHIKEVNHIDPLSIDSLHVSEIKNIEPISINKFNITNLPMLNMSLRQLPAVDMNIRKLPPISVGTHQEFHVPSNYTLKARFLGVEFFRINLDGHTMLVPKERFRREQARAQNRSFPETAVAGNPAIPSVHLKKETVSVYPSSCCNPRPSQTHDGVDSCQNYGKTAFKGPVRTEEYSKNSLSFGLPNMRYDMPESKTDMTEGYNSSISSGE